ncbi:hypothetical protein [Sphaerisporangium album]|nr:hypothetical protein [Sphaerisporangium album]
MPYGTIMGRLDGPWIRYKGVSVLVAADACRQALEFGNVVGLDE